MRYGQTVGQLDIEREVGPRRQRSLGPGASSPWAQGPFMFLFLFLFLLLPHATSAGEDCGSLIIITIMLKWQNGKLCAKCIKFIAHWPSGQGNGKTDLYQYLLFVFLIVIVSVSALLAHVFMWFHASALARITGQKLARKANARSQWDTAAVSVWDFVVRPFDRWIEWLL